MAQKEVITKTLPLSEIKIEAGTQIRLDMDDTTIQKYHHALVKLKAKFPPVIVFESRGLYYLADGFHRFKAYKMARRKSIHCEIRKGTKREAILYAVGCNAEHGLPRTNEDKKNAVMTLLSDKTWSEWSSNQIAKACKVSHTYVNKLRKNVTSNVSSQRKVMTKHGTMSTMDVSKIGQKSGKPTRNVSSDFLLEYFPKTTVNRLKKYSSRNKVDEVDVLKKALNLYLKSEAEKKKR